MTELTLNLIREIDTLTRGRATYVPDPALRDSWTSYAKDVEAGKRFAGDCDDWAMTALELLFNRGWPKDKLYRALVSSTGGDIDHMVGIVEMPNGEMWTIGDTFGGPARVSGQRAGQHRILQTSRMDERRGGLPLWRYWNQPARFTLFGRKRTANTAAARLKLSAKGAAFIKGHEKFMARAYDDFRPNFLLRPGDVVRGTLTIGYGHTGKDFKIGDVWSREQADRAFEKDVAVFEEEVRRQVRVPLSQAQYDALVSFCFNCGIGNFRSSTLLKRVNARAADHEVQAQFRRWIRSKGVVLRGLVTRREAEAQMWVGVYPAPSITTNAAPPALDVTPVPLVEETNALVKSMTLWLTGLGVIAPLLLEAARELRYVGLETNQLVIAQGAGLLMIISALVVFGKRIHEIMRSKK